MRLYVPVGLIRDNPFQSTDRDYSDIGEFAQNEIAPMLEIRRRTLGLQQLPQVRILSDSDLAELSALSGDLNASIVGGAESMFTIGAPGNEMWPVGESAWVLDLKDAWVASGLTVQTIFGHRRIRAIKWLSENNPLYSHGLACVEVTQITDDQMLREVWLENAARKDITAIEEAKLIEAAFGLLGSGNGSASRADVADYFGISGPRVSNLSKLLKLPPEIQAANLDGRLNGAQCEELLTIVQIDKAADGIHWGYRSSPGEVIDGMLSGEAVLNRAQLRMQVENLKREGCEVHDELAKIEFDIDNVVQPTCRKCPAKVAGLCFDKVCYQTKLEHEAKRIAAERLPGVKWLDNNEAKAFERWSYESKLIRYIDSLDSLC